MNKELKAVGALVNNVDIDFLNERENRLAEQEKINKDVWEQYSKLDLLGGYKETTEVGREMFNCFVLPERKKEADIDLDKTANSSSKKNRKHFAADFLKNKK